MTDRQVLVANVASNIVALALLLVCRRWPRVGRAMFCVLFAWAFTVNLRIALTAPSAYLEYARWAIEPYRRFILGPFARHTAPIVAAIAFGQLTVAALVAGRGRWAALGLAGAITFLLAIAPLGRGSAFPFSLIASAAALLLLRRGFGGSVAADLRKLLRRRRPAQRRFCSRRARNSSKVAQRRNRLVRSSWAMLDVGVSP
jgi:hypothetical protein